MFYIWYYLLNYEVQWNQEFNRPNPYQGIDVARIYNIFDFWILNELKIIDQEHDMMTQDAYLCHNFDNFEYFVLEVVLFNVKE